MFMDNTSKQFVFLKEMSNPQSPTPTEPDQSDEGSIHYCMIHYQSATPTEPDQSDEGSIHCCMIHCHAPHMH